MNVTTPDRLIIQARKNGLNAIQNANFGLVHSVKISIEEQEFVVFANGDVEAPDGYIYSIAKIHNNGLIGWSF